ncbi:MAG: hypothetical protein A3F72_05980 [Bacteroidetes bacterium RIFCSPLOWO2_12_FULL_35_15]|nr:MAG: hypothetical protein A3F72_05980 [Bacteroidetes bacterium RIFCSPLOWO2_12_FULL_35_15]
MNAKNNISNSEDDDLNEKAPHLSKLSGKSPFKADNDYFDSFILKLEDHIADLEEIKTEAPVLSNIPKYSPFELPTNYFDEFPTKIQDVVNNKTSKTNIFEWITLLIKPNFAIPVLTTFLIAFAGINYIEKQSKVTDTKMEYQLSEEEQLYLIDESIIIDAIVSGTSSGNEKTIEQNTNIENYLIENNIDERILNYEL